MRYSIIFSAAMATSASAHGVIRNVIGNNGVSMPGLCIADGTPRNCALNGCGAQADTAIIRDSDFSRGRSPLGWTQGQGDCKPETVFRSWMGVSTADKNKGAESSWGQEDSLFGTGQQQQRRETHMREMRGIFDMFANLPVIGTLALGGKVTSYPVETLVGDMYGQGQSQGLPTSDDSGKVKMLYRQVNQDGAGPMTAAIDATSGGSDASAFQSASVTKNVPGSGISGLSIARNMDFAVEVQMPEGMICQGKVDNVDNVCIVRIRNQALAGPFGGAAAFTQSEGARKRAVAYRLKKRFEITREQGKAE